MPIAEPSPLTDPLPRSDDLDRPLTRRERGAVIARVQALMEYWGITLDDLSAESPPALEPTPPAALRVKYRHPVSGDTWDGLGPHPEWLRHALLKEGLRVDELKPAEGRGPEAPPP